MQNRLRHLEEKVHNGEVPARETMLSDPETFKRMEEAARCVPWHWPNCNDGLVWVKDCRSQHLAEIQPIPVHCMGFRALTVLAVTGHQADVSPLMQVGTFAAQHMKLHDSSALGDAVHCLGPRQHAAL